MKIDEHSDGVLNKWRRPMYAFKFIKVNLSLILKLNVWSMMFEENQF